MTLRIYAEREHATLLGALDAECMAQLQPALDAFRRATGLRVSEYDNLIMPPGHARLLADLIETNVPRRGGDVASFRELLADAGRRDFHLYYQGE